MSFNRFFALSQYPLPHHLISRLIGRLAECDTPWLKNLIIQKFIKRYGVDMTEAADPDPATYRNFNAFFTRALKPGARPIVDGSDTLACPADGAISQLGDIEFGRLFQAKGHSFSLTTLLGGDSARAAPFVGGKFATVYLSPKDYHRVHMPVTGTLKEMVYVPGRLFSVNPATTEHVPELFARNERLVAIFDTAHGPMAMVLVGAMIVAGIETVWAGQVTPQPNSITVTHYGTQPQQPITLEKGAEMGRFKLGSTVILLFGPDAVELAEHLQPGSPTRMGELFGRAGNNNGVQADSPTQTAAQPLQEA